jgi:peptidoglycan/xylan/chitin deacetylase (PgdA/CDA1 family)
MRSLLKRVRSAFRRKGGPVILMYHRIATPEMDPWGLSVSPGRFRQQIHALRASRTVLSMDLFVARLEAQDLPRDAVAITFDDGYLDNLRQAKPILEAAGVPATVFITTGRIGGGEAFWWDELARMVLTRVQPMTLEVDATAITIDLPRLDPTAEPRAGWRAWEEPGTDREAAYQRLWRSLQGEGPERREASMERLREIFGAPPPCPDDLPMSVGEVQSLASQWVAIGAHGCTHQALTSLPAATRAHEIETSGAEVERLCGRPATGFAYPHGDRDDQTMEMVRAAGYRWACSAHEACVDTRRAGLYDLPRIAVGDWPANRLLAKLSETSP